MEPALRQLVHVSLPVDMGTGQQHAAGETSGRRRPADIILGIRVHPMAILRGRVSVPVSHILLPRALHVSAPPR